MKEWALNYKADRGKLLFLSVTYGKKISSRCYYIDGQDGCRIKRLRTSRFNLKDSKGQGIPHPEGP